jgi:hypothetical protein
LGLGVLGLGAQPVEGLGRETVAVRRRLPPIAARARTSDKGVLRALRETPPRKPAVPPLANNQYGLPWQPTLA